MVSNIIRQAIRPVLLLTPLALAAVTIAPANAQTLPSSRPSAPSSRPTTGPADVSGVSDLLKGRPVEAIRIVGNHTISGSLILNRVRTREGEPFDPATVEEDYKRIFDLNRFSNVQARVEATETGVIVSFVVDEQKQIKSLAYKGNSHVDTEDIQAAVDLKVGESIDQFRIALGRQAIERLYREKNYTYVQVTVNQAELTKNGNVEYDIVEGQKLRVRRVTFEGNTSFANMKLRSEVKTDYYLWLFRPGQLSFEELEDDVGALRRFYEQKGYFDVKIGRKIAVNADQTECQVTFIVDEGERYRVDRIIFNGVTAVATDKIKENFKIVEGSYYDNDVVQRDVREVVRAYSPYGYVYQAPPATPNPEYLHIDTRTVFRKEPGKCDLVYDIHEGKPFRMGREMVKGNSKTQDKVILRDINAQPGQLYNSVEIAEATDRLKASGYFTNVNIAPVGEEPDTRDVLAEVTEGRTAAFNLGAGISSNGGLAGEVSYEQKNYDIGNWPASWKDTFSDHTFTGAGQNFRAYVSPSTTGTSGGIRFVDPWLFDQPYIFSNELYYIRRIREAWDEDRGGDRPSIGKRLTRNLILSLNARAEDVNITNIEDQYAVPPVRAPQVLEAAGHTTVTGLGPSLRYDTANKGAVHYKGLIAQVGYERIGGLGGQVYADKFTGSVDKYITLNDDLFDRKTVLSLRSDVGYIDSEGIPIYEAFYAGGLGTIRGFKYRGVSPRDGLYMDPIGGNFMWLNSAELSYPIYTDIIRGTLFVDTGTVDRGVEMGTYRVAVGFGFRIIFPFAQQAPLAIDFGFPIVKDDADVEQLVSFSFGITY